MLQHAREFHEAGIPFIFDPGQGLPMFNGEELMSFINSADYVATNDYEAKLLQERTGKSVEELSKLVKALVVTQGPQGSLVFVDGKPHTIPSVKPSQVVDPTGCGDAYRAGLLYGIANDFDWPTTGRLASLLGSLKIAQRGAQNHLFTRDDISRHFREAFGHAPW
jgi:adenosine kinase